MFQPGNLRSNQQEYIVDEKRGKIVSTRSMTSFQAQLYERNYFNNLRPDLTPYDNYLFLNKWRVGEDLLNEYRKRLNLEYRRLWFLMPRASHLQVVNLLEEQTTQLTAPHIRGCRFLADRNWDEASKIVNHVEEKLQRIKKYGIQFPYFTPGMSLAECKQTEDEIADRLFREMQKAPFSVAAE